MTRLRYETKKLFNQKFYNFLEKTKDIGWDWQNLRHNPSLPLQFVIDNPKLDWSPDFFANKYKLKFVSMHFGLDLDIIKNNPDFDWDWNYINDYTQIEFRDIKKNINHSLDSGSFKPYNSVLNKPSRKFNINDLINQDINEIDFDSLCQDIKPIMNQNFESYLQQDLTSIKNHNITSITRYYENEKHGNIYHLKLLTHTSIWVNFNYVYNLINDKTITDDIIKALSKNNFIMEYYLILIDKAAQIIQKWFKRKLLSPYTAIGKRYLDLKFNTFKLLNN